MGVSGDASDNDEAAALAGQTRTALDRFRAFIADDVTPLQRELTRAGAPLDLNAKPEPDPKPGPDVDERGPRRDDD